MANNSARIVTPIAPLAPRETGAPAARARPQLAPLTRRASLNAVAALTDYAAQLVTGFVVTPLLVHGLGPVFFGAWEMLVRLGGYVSATDGRPTESLRLVIAQAQADGDVAAKRRLVGAALSVWVLLAPVVLALGAVFVAVSPTLVGVAAADAGVVRLTAGFLVGSMLLGSLAAVPESVLRGMNLGHTRMGMQATLHLVGGVMAAAAVWTGLGIAGLGGAMVLRAILTGLCFVLLVRVRVRWFAAARPTRPEVVRLLRMSGWLTAGDLIAKLVLASDVIILGIVMGPATVATYVLTGYAARVAVGVHVFTAGEALPGIGGLLGGAEYQRARRARRELLQLTWLYATVVGTAILLWNHDFLTLWIGPNSHGGPVVDLLLVLIAAQTAFIRLDSGMIDAALRPQQRVRVGLAAAAVTVTLAIILSQRLGMPGLCLGILLGRTVQSIAYPTLVARVLYPSGAAPIPWREGGRAAVTTLALFAGAAFVESRLLAATWFELATATAVTATAAALLAMRAGLSTDGRNAIAARAAMLAGRRPR